MAGLGGLQETTSYKVVIPFYAYGAASFLVAAFLLLLHTDIAGLPHFNPAALMLTHLMALGWGTMVIFGASHQLLPVLISGKLHSRKLAKITFYFVAVGIPFLVIGFYNFKFDWVLKTGAILVNIGTLAYLVNVFLSIRNSEKQEIHAWYVAGASIWLFSTTFFGLLLVYNFHSGKLLPENSISYLSLHAHLGLIGWFLLLVSGVGSKLIPLFLISKYHSKTALWWIFGLINSSLISFILLRLSQADTAWYYLPVSLVFTAVLLLGLYCRKAYKTRIRKKVDNQVRLSMISVFQMLLPVISLVVIITLLPVSEHPNLVILYGFCIFFGWITAIIMGMTFKTLPFIVWNKVYEKGKRVKNTNPPAPKALFNEKIYNSSMISYLIGFVIFAIGILLLNNFVLKTGAAVLLLSAVLYTVNVCLTLLHKPKK